MKPTIGRIVIYNTTEEDRKEMMLNPSCNEQTKLPAMIVAVWSDTCVNLKVFCDGDKDMWVTSAVQGKDEREWNWPDKV